MNYTSVYEVYHKTGCNSLMYNKAKIKGNEIRKQICTYTPIHDK